jgi:hypothetical protein
MTLEQAKKQMENRELAPGEHWMYLSRDGGRHGTLTNELNPEALGYRTRDVLYVWEGR